MPRFFYQDYLSRLGPDGTFACECGRIHKIDTRRVLMGDGVLEELPALLADLHGRGGRVWVLSDGNTEAAAGARCKELLSGWKVSGTILPASPKPRPTLELAAELARSAAGYSPELVLAVGSGVVSDLGKKVSQELGIPSWSVATAASVDAYTSGNSVFKSRTRHQTVWVTPSEAVLCDLKIMAAAPRLLFLSGVGDLLAKYLVHLDWQLAARISGEYLCPTAARTARESALRPLRLLAGSGPAALSSGELWCTVTDALLTAGLLMQALGNSRPASSSEHSVAHVWEIAGLVGERELDRHGLLVALASHFALEVYREFYRGLPSLAVDVAARVAALTAEPSWEAQLDPSLALFAEQVRAEQAAAQRGPEVWARRLAAFQREKKILGSLAVQANNDLEEGIAALRGINFPFEPAAFGLKPEAVYLPFPHIRLLRNRYNTFWLMHELGAEAEPLAALRRMLGLA